MSLNLRTASGKAKAVLRQRNTNKSKAAEQDNLGEIIRCINAGVNPNCSNPLDGSTALHYAAERGDLPLALKLLTCPNLLIDPRSDHGYTPLHIACRNRQIRMLKFLLKNGADPNARDRFSKTPLHIVVMHNSIIMVQILLKHGVELNVVDTMNNSPLFLAILVKGFLPMIKLLLQHGANPNLDTGSMPLFLECVLACHTEKEIEATLFLLEYGVDVNVTDKIAKRNALHIVGITGYVPLAAQLLKQGCDPFMKDFLGKKPVDIAITHEKEEVVYLLESYMKFHFVSDGLSGKFPWEMSEVDAVWLERLG